MKTKDQKVESPTMAMMFGMKMRARNSFFPHRPELTSMVNRKAKPKTVVRIRKVASATNEPTMKMSPWAKLIMPMMP